MGDSISPCIRTLHSKMKPAILLSFCFMSLVKVRGKVIRQDINETQNKKCTLFITCDINTSLKMVEEYRTSFCQENPHNICSLSNDIMKKLTKLNNQHFVNGDEPRGYGVVGEALGAIEGMMLLGSILILMIVIVPIIVGLALIYFGLPALLGDTNVLGLPFL